MLINPWYVVTAGHCVKGRKSIEWVRAGAHTVQDEVDGPRYDEELPHYQQMRVTAADIIPHEDYLPRGNNIENDIALIRLPQRVETNKGTQFACLPQPSNASNAALEVREAFKKKCNIFYIGGEGVKIGPRYTFQKKF